MFDIVAVGEMLIDFTPNPGGLFKANPGGAPCNFLTMAQKMGSRTAFIGKVGADAFGKQLRDGLKDQGINIKGLQLDERYPTTLAFVHLTEEGDRSFSFYRKGCADVMLSKADVDYNLIDNAKALHFGSLSFTAEPSRSTVFEMLEHAKTNHKIVTYDPNYRPALWSSEQEAVKYMKKGMSYADLVKVSEEELVLITDTQSLQEGCTNLHQMGVKLVLVTRGEKGVYYSYPKGQGNVAGIQAKVVDTTGAGDTFFGATIHQIIALKDGIEFMEIEELESILNISNVAAAICIEGYGGIPSIPTKLQVMDRVRVTAQGK